jgi:hypothetical protein
MSFSPELTRERYFSPTFKVPAGKEDLASLKRIVMLKAE